VNAMPASVPVQFILNGLCFDQRQPRTGLQLAVSAGFFVWSALASRRTVITEVVPTGQIMRVSV
jgi:hypothetical protein